jgi:hypothetical protein
MHDKLIILKYKKKQEKHEIHKFSDIYIKDLI